MIAYVLPTRDRPVDLARTLRGIEAMAHRPGEARVIVVDNASGVAPELPRALACGTPVTLLRRTANEGAAARNAGVEEAGDSCEWVVMLDDDSHPDARALTGPILVDRLRAQPEDVLAVSADIHLSDGRGRERGGLPEVFIGCGVAIRRDAFVRLGGYDPSFGYYAEEYDLSAKLIAMGGRVAFDPAWRVVHHKSAAGRDMNLIVERLVRNTCWVAARYAPETEREAEIERVCTRCRAIADNENAHAGLERGFAGLERTLGQQVRTPLTDERWARFTGLSQARDAVDRAMLARPFRTASMVFVGKNEAVARRALTEAGVELVPGVPGRAEVLAVGTMSPGPMLDAVELLSVLGRRVVAPWVGAGGDKPAEPNEVCVKVAERATV